MSSLPEIQVTFITHNHRILLFYYYLKIKNFNFNAQNKARQEINEIFGDADDESRKITNEDLFKLDYLDRVIKETMRFFPGAPTICRQVTEDFDTGLLIKLFFNK